MSAHTKEWSWAANHVGPLKTMLKDVHESFTPWAKTFMAGEAKDVRGQYNENECMSEAIQFERLAAQTDPRLRSEIKRLLGHQRVELEFKS